MLARLLHFNKTTPLSLTKLKWYGWSPLCHWTIHVPRLRPSEAGCGWQEADTQRITPWPPGSKTTLWWVELLFLEPLPASVQSLGSGSQSACSDIGSARLTFALWLPSAPLWPSLILPGCTLVSCSARPPHSSPPQLTIADPSQPSSSNSGKLHSWAGKLDTAYDLHLEILTTIPHL